ncbi:MAG: hypothetical protein IJ298_02315 [Ruminococcus sp.]|nr:hypothetical protein [Ruminococcus sp.]
MKKLLVILTICILCLSGCDIGSSDSYEPSSYTFDTAIFEYTNPSTDSFTPQTETTEYDTISIPNNIISIEDFSVGEEIVLGNSSFNIYKIDKNKNELYLLSQNNIAFTRFSDDDRDYMYEHDYEGSLIESFVNQFVDDLEDKGYLIKSSGIINKDDLYNLGFKDSITVSGRPYLADSVPEFVSLEKNFWLDGYYRVDTYAWVYFDEKIDTKSCDDEYGVRPIIVIDPSETSKQSAATPEIESIREIVDSNCAWKAEGGVANSYASFYFDLEEMTFTYTFKSSELERSLEFPMEIIDENTIMLDGFDYWYQIPTKLTIVNESKLRVRFVDDKYNDGDYYLNKSN